MAKQNNITFIKTSIDGFDNIPQAFMDLFEGKNLIITTKH